MSPAPMPFACLGVEPWKRKKAFEKLSGDVSALYYRAAGKS